MAGDRAAAALADLAGRQQRAPGGALLVEACSLAKHGGRQDRVTALAGTGRATPYVAAHVPGEVDKHLAKVAADFEVSERQVRRVLDQQVLPALRVVDLEIRDHLSSQTRHSGAGRGPVGQRLLPRRWRAFLRASSSA
ncbi:hypothetical protein OHA79_03775 [Streptomyces sp. NBC_00841]|uniref:hypothetical protein n=1 Tax=Streptomyces sp. NBC_00841 TaxID=2975847 RepID=UPI002DD969F4|nr:hypothetical protein [Streptomyces sp. NBC_00841]WRZ97115.1 hypothetical protein OHA79_03775 [Streptomyces sp. NBC_00841]